jgi:hypothetical protein
MMTAVLSDILSSFFLLGPYQIDPIFLQLLQFRNKVHETESINMMHIDKYVYRGPP